MADGTDIYRTLSRPHGRPRGRRQRKRRGGIHVNPANRGKLRATAGVKPGQKIPVAELQSLKNSSSPAVRKRATFALNARSWGH